MNQVTSTTQWGAQAAGTGGASCQTTKPREGVESMAARQVKEIERRTNTAIGDELIRARDVGQREGKEDASHEVKQLQEYLGDWQRQAVALDAKCKELERQCKHLNREVEKELVLHIETSVKLSEVRSALATAQKEKEATQMQPLAFRIVRRISSRLRLGGDIVETVAIKSVVPEGFGYLLTI